MSVDIAADIEDRPLTRTDVEYLVYKAGGTDKLNLVGQNLREINLSYFDLTGANLSRANLSRANLKDAKLSRVDLTDANLSGANLSRATLNETNLSGATLEEAVLSQTNLTTTNLKETNLSGVDLSGTNLSGVDLSQTNLSGVDLRGINLSETILSGADLRKTNLSGTDLRGTNLRGTDLSRANLSNANLSRVVLNTSILSGANLRDAILHEIKLSKSLLSGADLSGADLSGADLSKSNLSWANLSNANLSGANLSETILSDANLSEANLSRTNLSGANLKNAYISEREVDLLRNIDGKGLYEVRVESSELESKTTEQDTKPQSMRLDSSSTVSIRINEEPLTAQNFASIISVLTELHTKFWLIAQERLGDLIEYTQTHNPHFAEEAHLVIGHVVHNSPADVKFNMDFSPQGVVEAFIKLIDGIWHGKQRHKQAILENEAREQEMTLKKQEMELKQQMMQSALASEEQARLIEARQAELVLTKKLLEIEEQRYKNLEKRIEIQKIAQEAGLELAGRTIDTLSPQADAGKREMFIRSILPNILQLDSAKGVELISPSPQTNQEETKPIEDESS